MANVRRSDDAMFAGARVISGAMRSYSREEERARRGSEGASRRLEHVQEKEIGQYSYSKHCFLVLVARLSPHVRFPGCRGVGAARGVGADSADSEVSNLPGLGAPVIYVSKQKIRKDPDST